MRYSAKERQMESPEQAAQDQSRAPALLELQPDAMLILDQQGRVTSRHQGTGGCAELFQQPCAALPHINDLLPAPISAAILAALHGDKRRGRVSRDISCQDRHFEVSCQPDGYSGLHVMIRDVTPYKAAENTMRELAYHDSLTGLPNRSFFKQNFESAIERAKRLNKHVCVLFIDLDRFKRINDTLGHSVGDELLVEVAERLRRCIRATDLMMQLPNESVARLGGDEFTIVAADLDSTDDVKKLAQRLLNSLSKTVKLADHELVVTPSIGISVYPSDGDNVESLLKNADAAMYHAKHQGRNNFQFFDQPMNEKALRRLKLESQLRAAIENGDLFLEYQPQVDLQTLQVIGVESLARWHHKDLGTITPDVFIPIAEESGLIVPLGDTLMELGCQQLQAWEREGLSDFRLAMNFSGLQFRREHIISSLQRLLQKYNVPAHRLELEITEGVIARDPEETARTLEELRTLGIKLTIDDFGTGYSSLQHLSDFPLDALKIDRLFTAEIRKDDKNTSAVADAIIAIAQQLNLEVIAEGVETQTTLDYIRSRGCSAAQGYLFSRPIDAAGCSEFIRHNRASQNLPKHSLSIAS